MSRVGIPETLGTAIELAGNSSNFLYYYLRSNATSYPAYIYIEEEEIKDSFLSLAISLCTSLPHTRHSLAILLLYISSYLQLPQCASDHYTFTLLIE